MTAAKKSSATFAFYPAQLVIGQWLDVEIETYLPGDNLRYKSRFIGACEKRYILMEQPEPKRYGLLRNDLKEGQSVVIRAIAEAADGECLAFKVDINGLINHPARLVSVAYPGDVVRRELRIEKRHLADISCKIQALGSSRLIDAVIVDISSGGCRIECPVSEDVTRLKQQEINVLYQDPVSHEAVQRQAKVRSQRKQGNLLVIGCSFG